MSSEKEVPAKTQEAPEDEYDAAWEALNAGTQQEEEQEPPKEEKGKPSAAESGATEEQGEKPQEPKKADSEVARSKKYGSIESMEKAIDDLKRENNKVREKLRLLEEAQKTGTKKEQESAQKAVDEAKQDLRARQEAVYQDYPELRDLLDPLLEKVQAIEQRQKEEERERQIREQKAKEDEAFERFERIIKPKVQEKHEDFTALITDPDQKWFKWAQEQSPAVRFAVFSSDDPADIIWAIDLYKQSLAKGQAVQERTAEQAKKEQRISLAQSMRGGAASLKAPLSVRPEEEDYDALWEEAERMSRQRK